MPSLTKHQYLNMHERTKTGKPKVVSTRNVQRVLKRKNKRTGLTTYIVKSETRSGDDVFKIIKEKSVQSYENLMEKKPKRPTKRLDGS